MLEIHKSSSWRVRCRAAGIHLMASALVALLSAFLVFDIWYPGVYREISGGRELFLLVISVDVVLGPLITFTIFNASKPRIELRRDIAVVAMIQCLGLAYGLHVVMTARPVHMVFEYDRFRVVHAADIVPELLAQAPAGIDVLPLSGPTLLALRPFKDSKEEMEATMAALGGVSLASRPDLWRPYGEARIAILQAARPGSQLLLRFVPRAEEILRVLNDVGRMPDQVVYLPLVGRKAFWTVFLDPATAQVLAAMPLDSF